VGAGCPRPAQMLDFRRRVTKYRGPCSTFRTEAEFLIRPDVPFGFWGHDSAMEWSFFVSEEALKRLQPTMAIANRKKVFDMVTSDSCPDTRMCRCHTPSTCSERGNLMS
jgi:hypothetical protein